MRNKKYDYVHVPPKDPGFWIGDRDGMKYGPFDHKSQAVAMCKLLQEHPNITKGNGPLQVVEVA